MASIEGTGSKISKMKAEFTLLALLIFFGVTA